MSKESLNLKKKKKGHAPAHQNTFAFVHNPKSKTTAVILASANVRVCRRCHDKIEWRKTYRKYKPRTQPGTCNGCKKRNVKAAYHTLCDSCTINSVKAKETIKEHTKPIVEVEDEEDADPLHTPKVRRACAVCVKEIALPDPEDENDGDLLESMGKISLRERKTLERQLAKKTKKSTKKKNAIDEDDENEEDELEADLDFDDNEKESDDEDDPFLKAVGGADKLLTGEAYQQKLLAQEHQQRSE
jgi:hypothetical protein